MASSNNGDDGTMSAETSEKDEFLPGIKDVDTFTQTAFKSIIGAIKSSNELPASGDDFDYYSSYESFRTLMDMEGSRILHMIQKMMRYHGIRGNITKNVDIVDIEEKFDVLVDANDQLLEKVGILLDEAAGLGKKESPLIVATATVKTNKPLSGAWNRKSPASKIGISSNFRLLAAKNIQRPQLKFKDIIDNSGRPFVPKIKHKPNALKSLSESLLINKNPVEDIEDGHEFPHPYHYELEQWKPLPSQLEKGTIVDPLPIENCPPTLIDTEEDLNTMVDLLKQEKEIAVDLEHHAYRTYQGITCLMQLSTRKQDFIIDTLLLRNELHVLNEVFTDPNIVKVFHGADSDIDWLQRDLGLYVVNMFDTGQAARVLNLPHASLAYLLSTYCQVEADKQYQLADWRIRPLPQELIKYAQEDTHYLLYIYDKLRNELIENGNNQNNLLLSTLERSKNICAKTYKKPTFYADDYLGLYKHSKKAFNSQQLAALKQLYAWRDGIARTEDESLRYVLPNHMLLQICEVLPKEPQGILACCNPIPPLVRQNLMDIHTIIMEARKLPLVKPQLITRERKPTKYQHPKYDTNTLLSCPHDMSHQDKQMVTDNEPLSKIFSVDSVCDVEVKQFPVLTALVEKPEKKCCPPTEAQKKASEIDASFVNLIEKFLPLEILEKTNQGKPIPEVKDEDKWKLLPPTVKTTSEERTSNPEVTIPSTELVKIEILEPECSLSVRQQHLKTKKRISATTGDMENKKLKEDGDVSSKVKEKTKAEPDTKKPGFLAPAKDFQAYDYSQVDYGIFDKPDVKSNKKHFDPDGDAPHSGHLKSHSKGKGHFSSGRKSLTYHKGKPSSSSKIQWPKR